MLKDTLLDFEYFSLDDVDYEFPTGEKIDLNQGPEEPATL